MRRQLEGDFPSLAKMFLHKTHILGHHPVGPIATGGVWRRFKDPSFPERQPKLPHDPFVRSLDPSLVTDLELLSPGILAPPTRKDENRLPENGIRLQPRCLEPLEKL